MMKTDASAAGGGHMHSSVEMPGASTTAAPQKPSEFTVPVERQQMIGVTYAVAERRPLEATLRTVGIVEPEAERVFEYVARVDGYVDKLAVSSPGQMVKKGEALLTIYSPDLLATEQELLEMLRTSGSADRLVESAKRRLKLWNVSDEDIDQLLKSAESLGVPHLAFAVRRHCAECVRQAGNERKGRRSLDEARGSVGCLAVGGVLRKRAATS